MPESAISDAEKLRRFEQLSALFRDDSAGFQWLFESLERTMFGILITDPSPPHQTVIYANSAITEMTGYRYEELLGQDPMLLEKGDHAQPGVEKLREQTGLQRDCRVVLRNYRKDGSLFWNEVTSIPIRTETGQLKCCIQILKDVSNCQQAKSAKELLEERLRAVLSASTDAVITIDDGGIIHDADGGVEAIFGYEPHELLGQNVSLLMPAPDRDQHDSYIARFLETGQPRVIGIGREVIAQRKDGSRFPAQLAVSQVEQQRLFTGIVRDLTRQRQSEDSLAREHQLNEKMISTSPGIILILDTDGRIVRFNTHFADLCGWSLTEVEGQAWAELFVLESERADFQQRFQDALDGIEGAAINMIVLTRSGQRLQLQWETVPMTSPTGLVTGLLCSGLDVTEQRRLEREVLEATTLEQRRIGQDLHDVVGQELTGMAMLADSLRVALGRQGMAETKLAERISQGVSSALTKVRMLSRGLNPVDVDSEGLTAALHAIANRIQEIHQIECQVDCPAQVHLGDNLHANHLYRIAEEATTNALKHAQPSRIVIGLHERDHVVELSVQDDGSGFAADAGGKGLGLRIMRYRANQIGGTFKINPGPQAGTRISCQVLNE